VTQASHSDEGRILPLLVNAARMIDGASCRKDWAFRAAGKNSQLSAGLNVALLCAGPKRQSPWTGSVSPGVSFSKKGGNASAIKAGALIISAHRATKKPRWLDQRGTLLCFRGKRSRSYQKTP
jgi:hypothetical protein